MIWFTIDVEEVTDMNFSVRWENPPYVEYEKYIDEFISFSKNFHSTAFVLGGFAKKYPDIVKKISKNGIEIASHGFKHELVYRQKFTQWSKELSDSKKLLEDLISKSVNGYRSPSWSMPFEKRYYEELVKIGFEFSSSYFPMKNYMYGNSINKTESFCIYTEFGKIEERPIPKFIIPFSGGFYLRVLPLWVLKVLFKKSKNSTLYVHPYELMDQNLMWFFKRFTKLNLDFFLAFYSTGFAKDKIREIIKSV